MHQRKDTKCRLELSEGFEIGYQKPLAKAPVAIELEEGTHYLFARNGRGKTTLLRTLAGSIKPINGKHKTFSGMQYLSEDLKFDQSLTVASIFRSLLSKKALKKAQQLIEDLEIDLSKTYGKLSTGNKRKVILIISEFSEVKNKDNIILLDEPLTGLDQNARDTIYQYWSENNKNILRVISCHPDNDGMVCNSALTINEGKIHHYDASGIRWKELKTILS